MPVVMPTHLATLAKARTPDEFKEMAWQLLGPALKNYRVMGTDVLFVTYIEPPRQVAGPNGRSVELFQPDKSQQEILFQGNVGLVIGLGPLVNKYDAAGHPWEDAPIALDDWVVTRFSDAWEIHIDGVSCRLIDPENLRGVITDPAIITNRPLQSVLRKQGLMGATALDTAYAGPPVENKHA